MFHTWRMIVDELAYYNLCKQWEQINQAPADPLDGFFPAYRKLLPLPEANPERCCA